MRSITFGCNDLIEGIEFATDVHTFCINCIRTEPIYGNTHGDLYAYYNFLGPRLCKLNEQDITPYAAVSIFPYDVQTTIDDATIDEALDGVSWHKVVVNVRCRVPKSFDTHVFDSGNARTTQTVICNIDVVREVNPMHIACNAVTDDAKNLINRIIGYDSDDALNRFKNLWFEVSSWLPIDNLLETEIDSYKRMANAYRTITLAASHENGKEANLRIRIGNGYYSSDSSFNCDGLIRFIIAIIPFAEAGMTVSTFDWEPNETDCGTIESKDDAIRLARFASTYECDNGYNLARFLVQSIIASPWGVEIIASDEQFAYTAAKISEKYLHVIREAIGSYRFDKMAGDLARYKLDINGSGIDDDWGDLYLADSDYQPTEPTHEYVACSDALIYDDDDYGYDDYGEDCQDEEYFAFQDILPLVSSAAREKLFAALPGLKRFADEKTGEPIERDDSE